MRAAPSGFRRHVVARCVWRIAPIALRIIWLSSNDYVAKTRFVWKQDRAFGVLSIRWKHAGATIPTFEFLWGDKTFGTSNVLKNANWDQQYPARSQEGQHHKLSKDTNRASKRKAATPCVPTFGAFPAIVAPNKRDAEP